MPAKTKSSSSSGDTAKETRKRKEKIVREMRGGNTLAAEQVRNLEVMKETGQRKAPNEMKKKNWGRKKKKKKQGKNEDRLCAVGAGGSAVTSCAA